MSIMVADPSGDCAVVEILNDKGECSKIFRRGDGYLYALNHYLSKEHKAKYPRKRYFSEAREIFLDSSLHHMIRFPMRI